MTWFAESAETYEIEIVDPDDPEKKATVTCRRLNADQHARVVDTIHDEESGEGATRMAIVRSAIVKWTIPDVSYSDAALGGLDPQVFLQIWAGIRQEDVNPFVTAAMLLAERAAEAAGTTDTASPAPAEPVDDVDESQAS